MKRARIGLAVLALPTLLLSLDVSVVYLALSQLSADLRADATQQLWILDIYSITLAGFLVTMGALGDRIGRRRLLLTAPSRSASPRSWPARDCPQPSPQPAYSAEAGPDTRQSCRSSPAVIPRRR